MLQERFSFKFSHIRLKADNHDSSKLIQLLQAAVQYCNYTLQLPTVLTQFLSQSLPL